MSFADAGYVGHWLDFVDVVVSIFVAVVPVLEGGTDHFEGFGQEQHMTIWGKHLVDVVEEAVAVVAVAAVAVAVAVVVVGDAVIGGVLDGVVAGLMESIALGNSSRQRGHRVSLTNHPRPRLLPFYSHDALHCSGGHCKQKMPCIYRPLDNNAAMATEKLVLEQSSMVH